MWPLIEWSDQLIYQLVLTISFQYIQGGTR